MLTLSRSAVVNILVIVDLTPINRTLNGISKGYKSLHEKFLVKSQQIVFLKH